MIVIYTYKGCSSCRKATRWLAENDIVFEERPIREKPPTINELRRMLEYCGGNRKRLFNTAGHDYRQMGLSSQLDSLSEERTLGLLASNGNLIKRPFLLGPNSGLVGFKAEEWAKFDWRWS